MNDFVSIEAVEVCPHCDSENEYPNWDVEKQGYIAICQTCGEQIMLCDECYHSDDNPQQRCDWHCVEKNGCREGHCFRGITKEKAGASQQEQNPTNISM